MYLLSSKVVDMRVFKIVLLSVLSVIDAYLLYSTIGYLVLGINTPPIIGEKNTVFMGMYIMSITFFVLFALLTTIIIILAIKFYKKKR